MFSQYGAFSNDGHEFRINTRDIPRSWYNYMHTDSYITFTSQCGAGQGFLQDRLGRRLMPVTARGLYALCEDKAWNLFGLPVYDSVDSYECVHSLGSTQIKLEKYGVKSEYTLFVPCEDDPYTGCEASVVFLTNTSDAAKEVKLISYTENDFDGVYRYQGYNTGKAEKDDRLNGLHYGFNEIFDGEKRHFEFFLYCSAPVTGWDCARNAFIGTYGSVQDPAALHKGGCSNSSCIAEKMGFAVQTTVKLDPGSTKAVVFLTGITSSLDRVQALCERFSEIKNAGSELARVDTKYVNRLSGGSELHTPDPNLDNLLNLWLKYQTDMGSRWARVRHNGYRDIASDTECLACFNPNLAWQRIKRLLAYQYSNGYAPRTFIDGAIKDNNFADCTVWLTFTVYYIICELGDLSLLNEEVPFNDGTAATVYEHLKRSVEFLYGFTGHYGLIQIWGGDWNDCMNTTGLKHKGVSVWLSIAWTRAAKQLSELARESGRVDDAERFTAMRADMCEKINKYGWDKNGGYYIYARSDDDELIGDSSCDEGKVFLNPQLWAVLAGGLGENREDTAIENAYRLLADPLGTRVSTPPYTEKNAHIGSIAEKAPGVQENGGVYLHSMCWKLAVDALRGDEKRVSEDITSIVPFYNPVVAGRAEPYIICNCYMGKETGYRYGTPGQSWRTASGQWFLKSMNQFVFGLNPTLKGLTLRPCLPEDWTCARAEKEFRGCTYRIEYRRTGKRSILFNGKPLDTDLLPLENGDVLVTF